MIWQDIVISLGGWAMTFAIVPTLIGRDKPALSTCLFTSTILFTFAFCYATLGLWSSTLSTGVLAVAWFTLAWQQWQRRHAPENK